MDDTQILELYFSRNESALSETANKYDRYCHSISYGILQNCEDAEECVNDTYFRAWNSIPPHRPSKLSAFLGKITRNLSLNRYEALSAEKRGAGQISVVLDELAECIPSPTSIESAIDDFALSDILNRFLVGLTPDTRKMFLQRYWYFCPIHEISANSGYGASKVKMTLMRTRNKIKVFLENEGITL